MASKKEFICRPRDMFVIQLSIKIRLYSYLKMIYGLFLTRAGEQSA